MSEAFIGSFMMLLFAAFLWTIVFLMFKEERKNTRKNMDRYEEWLDERYRKDEENGYLMKRR